MTIEVRTLLNGIMYKYNDIGINIVQIDNFVNCISSLRTTTGGHICYMCFPLSYKFSMSVSSV